MCEKRNADYLQFTRFEIGKSFQKFFNFSFNQKHKDNGFFLLFSLFLRKITQVQGINTMFTITPKKKSTGEFVKIGSNFLFYY